MELVHELRLCVFGAGYLPRRVPAGLLLMHDYFEPPTYWDNLRAVLIMIFFPLLGVLLLLFNHVHLASSRDRGLRIWSRDL
jgi:hypothetical protein